MLLVGRAFDAQLAVRITGKNLGFVIALFDISTLVVLFDPAIDVLHVEGHNLTESRDLCFEIAHGGMEKRLEQSGIKGAQFLGEPMAARKSFLDVKAIGRCGIQVQVKTQFDDEQGMVPQERAQLSGVDHPFANADEKSLDVGDCRMTMGATIDRTLGLPLLNHGLIKQ